MKKKNLLVFEVEVDIKFKLFVFVSKKNFHNFFISTLKKFLCFVGYSSSSSSSIFFFLCDTERREEKRREEVFSAGSKKVVKEEREKKEEKAEKIKREEREFPKRLESGLFLFILSDGSDKNTFFIFWEKKQSLDVVGVRMDPSCSSFLFPC